MFVAFGVLALVLAAIGLYSVIAYNVAQRTHELGVRVALGAQARDVVRLVVVDGLRLAAVGVAIGAAVALWAGKWVKPLLFNVSPKDPAVFVIVAVTLIARGDRGELGSGASRVAGGSERGVAVGLIAVIPSEARDLGEVCRGAAVQIPRFARDDICRPVSLGAAEDEQPLFSHVSATYTSPRINQRPSRFTHWAPY